ncbi:MAG: glycoside hydrolase family 57 protein [Sterolibacterium sp.]|nr:glycoside hydrolase family 57 protein [Sterolibacterium sp.]
MNSPLDLVFLWHMHQPDYRDHRQHELTLPWVYLHVIKDYTDMVAHLEQHPRIHAVVNFVPVLLEQIEDYAVQFESGNFRDQLLRLLAFPDLGQLSASEREFLLNTCFRSNHTTMLAPFRQYQRLHNLYLKLTRAGNALNYLSGAYFADLITWYHLAWTGETERRRQPILAQLMSQGQDFTLADRQALLRLIGEDIKSVIPRYQALAQRGQIEISSTPQTHPLAPLLIDFKVARETQPESPLPLASVYPGGRMRVTAQIEAARASHARRFGAPPVGMWPAEGAISTAFVQKLAAQDCRWIASGEGVLHSSLQHHGGNLDNSRAVFRPWRLESAPGLTLFFRNERLSDLIGFEYAKWHGQDAAQHFIGELEAIHASTPDGERAVVSIIMDGENAWEHYPYNGYFFFEDLYVRLEQHPNIRTTTFAELLDSQEPPPIATLPELVAGSWVYGTMSTWIGDTNKNRAWDLLCEAKQSYDLIMAGGSLGAPERTAAETQLAICESSDWFWWFGDYNPAATVASFDRLFRRNLANLYHLLGLLPPAHLDQPISGATLDAPDTEVQGKAEGGGAMRRALQSL